MAEIKAKCLEDSRCKSFDYVSGADQPYGHLCDVTDYHDRNAYGHQFCKVARDQGNNYFTHK